jgi:uncharacterized protein YcfL
MQRTLTLVLGLALLSGAPGCNTAPVAANADRVNIKNYPNIEVDASLGYWIVSSAPIESRDGGILKVSTPIRFETSHQSDISIQYKYTFFDGRGMPISSQADFRYMQIPARTQVFLEGSALDANAASWRLFVRPAR